MDVEKRQLRLQKNSDNMDVWMGRLLRAARKLEELQRASVGYVLINGGGSGGG